MNNVWWIKLQLYTFLGHFRRYYHGDFSYPYKDLNQIGENRGKFFLRADYVPPKPYKFLIANIFKNFSEVFWKFSRCLQICNFRVCFEKSIENSSLTCDTIRYQLGVLLAIPFAGNLQDGNNVILFRGSQHHSVPILLEPGFLHRLYRIRHPQFRHQDMEHLVKLDSATLLHTFRLSDCSWGDRMWISPWTRL